MLSAEVSLARHISAMSRPFFFADYVVEQAVANFLGISVTVCVDNLASNTYAHVGATEWYPHGHRKADVVVLLQGQHFRVLSRVP
jgi:hypothetical protein